MGATTILPEYRFPLHLEPASEGVWRLYEDGKKSLWEPSRGLDWAVFERARYADDVLAAACLVWSHQVWRLYGRLTESPALLVRFCLERERESDPKYFLALRCAEDAKHLDACDRFAKVCGGLVDVPADAAYATAFECAPHRDALDSAQALDAYVAAHVAYADGLDAAILAAMRDRATDPLARPLLGHLAADRARQTAFGWTYLAGRQRAWTEADRRAVADRLDWVDARLIASGVLAPWRSQLGGAREVVTAHAVARAFGGLERATAEGVIGTTTARLNERLAALGLTRNR